MDVEAKIYQHEVMFRQILENMQVLTASIKTLTAEALTLNSIMKEHERKLKGIN